MRGSGSPACISWVSMRMDRSDIGGSPDCNCHANTLPCPYAFMERHPGVRQLALCRRAASTAAVGKAVRVKQPTERFTGRVDHYARYRPSYPSGALDLLESRCGLSAAAVVADIGSGHGQLNALRPRGRAQVLGVQ